MLQWMGGSRRKVTTSRKSTQKRQKQYFEQRKRQQQQIAGLEGYSDKTGTCSPHQENNRSLDILSLLNLSTIGQECQECNTSCPSARESLEKDFLTRNYQAEQCPTTTQMETIEIFPADLVEFKEPRTSSNYEEETECPRKVSFGSASHTKALNGNSAKVDQLKIATDHNLSVLDLLGDDGKNSDSDGSLVHEAHVAFSVQGLGKLDMETPVNSPRQPGRTFIYGSASPLIPTKRAHSTRHRDCRLDDLEPEVGLATRESDIGLLDSIYQFSNDLMCDVDMPFAGSSPELPLFSKGMTESFSDPKQKQTSGQEFLQLNQNSNNRKSFFSDDEIFYNCEDQDEYRWNASPSFLVKNFLDEECDLSWKNWPYDFDSTTAGNLIISNWEKEDCSFESFCMQKRRPSAKAAHRFNISEPSAPYIKHKVSENYHDFIIPGRTWCPTVGRTCVVRDVTNQPAWSSFITEDARDSLSLLSEESCSSSAVWREATKKSPHNPTAQQKMRVHAGECSSPVTNLSEKNDIFAQEHGKNRDSPQQRDSINGQGKCSRMSNSSTSTPAHYSTTTSQETGADE